MRWLLLSLIVLLPSLAEASTINASSCSNTDVATAIALAVDGDTVQIPGGTCTWAAEVTISSTNASITVQGVGAGTEAQCAVGGQTTYTCINRAGRMLVWTTKATGNSPAGFTQLKNMSIFATGGSDLNCNASGEGSVRFSGNTQKLRITGMKFAHTTSCGSLVVLENISGVLDHSTFTSSDGNTHDFVVTHSKYAGVGAYGDKSWASPLLSGTADGFYVEDTTFTSTLAQGSNTFFTDHQGGARVVMRFSTFNGGSIQSHGTESSGRTSRGPVRAEYYRNKFPWGTPNSTTTQIALRGVGTAYTFDNKATGAMTRVVDMNTYRAWPGQSQSTFYLWAYCGRQSVTLTRSGSTVTGVTSRAHGINAGTPGPRAYIKITGADQAEYNGDAIEATGVDATTFTYTVVGSPTTPATGTILEMASYDGNTDDTGYPCLDQVGRGPGDLLSGDPFTTQTPVAPLNQPLSPHYCFNNTDDGAVSACRTSSGSGTDVIHEERDYYNSNAAFNGTTGIGRGTRASRPATCTTGVAYWSTDGGGNWNTSTTETYSNTPGEDGALDKCTATDTWTNDWYVPYTYPHPLVSAATVTTVTLSGNMKLSGSARLE